MCSAGKTQGNPLGIRINQGTCPTPRPWEPFAETEALHFLGQCTSRMVTNGCPHVLIKDFGKAFQNMM